MITVDALQGTPEWLAARAKRLTASEAPAMMGASKYQTRTALLKQKATGLTPDVDNHTQRLFDRGHASEAAARQIVEAIIGESLYPVTGSLDVDGLPLLASFDGLTAMDDIVWETKLWNASLAESVRAGQLDPHYYWQLEQQLLVSGAERAYFTCTDGTPENTVGMWYESLPDRRAALIAGWKQFAIDLEAYEHTEKTVAPVAATIEALPALFVQVEGKVLATNLDAFKLAAQSFIDGIKTELVNDQDFADADKMVKFLKDGEERLELAKSQALAQTASIDELFRTVDAISEQMRVKRLALDKLVKAEKINRKAAIINKALTDFKAHIAKLNERIGGCWMPGFSDGLFSEATSGLKSLDSMRDKVSTALANSKIASNEIADTIEANIKAIPEAWKFLFADMAQICTKPGEDFARLAESRIAAHKAAEAEKAEAAKKAEDARVAAAVEAERKAGEARAAEAVRQADERAAEIAREDKNLADIKAAKPAANDQGGTADETRPTSPETSVLHEAASASTPPTQEEKRAAVVDVQDDIADFINSRSFGTTSANQVRAILVEFVKFQAERGMAVAA